VTDFMMSDELRDGWTIDATKDRGLRETKDYRGELRPISLRSLHVSSPCAKLCHCHPLSRQQSDGAEAITMHNSF